jgi:nucleoside-diphosphate-sugar epimerase
MKVMVLGGRGFVGSAVVRQLLARGDTEVVIASRSASVAPGGKGPVQIAVDSRDVAGMAKALAGIDAVINCVTGDGPSIAHGADALAKAALQSGKPRIVHLSTMSVYGGATGVITEQASLRDELGWYGQAKIQAEAHMNAYAEQGGQVVTLRPGVVIGSGSAPWVQRIARWLQAGRLADLGPLGDGPANLVDVEDVAQAAVLALRHPLAKGQTVAFNLAAPDSPRWNEYFCDLTLALDAGPLQRWGARRLKWEVYGRGVPLKVLERLGSKLKLDTSSWAEGIPPSLMGLWAQQITLSSATATEVLGVKWTPYSQTLGQAVAWVKR